MFKEYSKFMGYVVLSILIIAATSGVIYQFSVVGENVAFKNSHQYEEGMAQRAITLKAQIAEIDVQIMKNPNMADQLRAQRKVLEIQLQGAK